MPTTESTITKAARKELVQAVRLRYGAATGEDRRRVLSEFVAVTGYHPKYAIELLNREEPERTAPQRHNRPKLYDEAARRALIVLWEASDRVCGKRLKPLLGILLPSLERHGHLRLDAVVRAKVLAMSAATMDRLLREPKAATGLRRRQRVMPEIRRRVPVRTFADWQEPPPGSMEMDLVAHCGDVNRGSYVHSLVLTDIASAWTECTPLVMREKTLLIEALERVRLSLPFPLRALDVDNGSEFLNEALIDYCISHGIELTRCRPYRKNDQAWIEQKNGAVVRRMIGYRRFEGIAAAQRLARLYAASRFFVNFFQPSFKLAEKSRTGAQVTKRYHAPQTPCERLIANAAVLEPMKARLREVAATLDPLRLLEEIRTMQSHLVALADGGQPYEPGDGELDLAKFLADLSSAWHAGEIRPTHVPAPAPPRYLRRIEIVPPPKAPVTDASGPAAPPTPSNVATVEARPQNAESPNGSADRVTIEAAAPALYRRISRPLAFDLIWPDICRRLDARPTLNASELFDQLRAEFPGRYGPGQVRALQRRLKAWRWAAAARGVVVRPLHHRTSGRPRTYRTRRDPFEAHWPELCQLLETDPDQTGRELFEGLQSRYPGQYGPGQLRTLQRRLEVWRQQAARRLVFGISDRSGPFLLAPLKISQEVGEGGADAPPPPTPLSTPISLEIFSGGEEAPLPPLDPSLRSDPS